MAMEAEPEGLAYVATLNTSDDPAPDALCVVDVDPASSTYAQVVGRLDMPNVGDELHHFGWNACSSALCPYAPHPHVERRYLVVPGLRSSRIHIIDVGPDPRSPELAKVIEADELARRACWAGGRSTAGPRSWPTTCGGTSATTRCSPASGGRPTWSKAA
jgi:selenium-binding protein 1